MSRSLPAFLAFLLLFPAAFVGASGNAEKELGPGLYARIDTSRGEMVFLLDWEHAPLTTANFCGLAAGILPNGAKPAGTPYYDGLEFYRAIPQYAVFSGDPANDGTGGPGYSLPRETGSVLSAATPGTLVMNGYPTESDGSRFFITRQGDGFLDAKYTSFGSLVVGRRVLDRIREGDVIKSVVIERKGAEAEGLVLDESVFASLLAEARQRELDALSAENPDLGAAILALGENRAKTPSGIFYAIGKQGSGEKPRAGQRVTVQYTGSLPDGTVFDSTRQRNQPFAFVLGKDSVIAGWVEVILDMRPGEQRTAVIPPNLAYGTQGYGPIPPNSWLRFDVELVSVADE